MTVLASFNDINIVSTSDTLGGSPRIEGTRIGVHHLQNEATDHDFESAQSKYPHLSKSEIRAAFHYYDQNKYDFELLNRHRDDTARWATARHIKCLCESLFATPQEFMDHLEHHDSQPAEEDTPSHGITTRIFPGTITCTCDQTFDTFQDFTNHFDTTAWPPDPDHFIAYIALD